MRARLRSSLVACALGAVALGVTLAWALTPVLAVQLQASATAGEFHFARMIYTDLPQYRGFRGGWWQQDYPEAESHLLVTVRRYTRVNVGEPVTVRLTDAAIFDYPWLYATQVGYWDLREFVDGVHHVQHGVVALDLDNGPLREHA